MLLAVCVALAVAQEPASGEAAGSEDKYEPARRLVQSLASRLRSFNRNVQAVPLESREYTEACQLFATEQASLVTPRTNTMVHEFPTAVTKIMPILGTTTWLPVFDLRIAYLDVSGKERKTRGEREKRESCSYPADPCRSSATIARTVMKDS